MKQFALVTGASQGLGKAFATELSRRGISSILVSLLDQGLEDFAMELQKEWNIEVHHYETDLTDKNNIIRLTEWVNRNFNLFLLINNAGCGGSKSFTDASIDYIERILLLNVMATSMLTHQLLPNMLALPKAYILNISSMAAYTPTGYKTVYPASKAFVHHFSRGLSEELKNTNVVVSVTNPGAMKTNADVTERINKQGIFGKLTLLDTEKAARKCLDRLFKKDRVILLNPLSWTAMHLVPRWLRQKVITDVIRKGEIETV